MLDQGATAQPLNRFDQAPSFDLWSQVGYKVAKCHAVPFDGEPLQHTPLHGRQTLELTVEEASDAAKRRGACLLQEGVYPTAKYLVDSLADDLQGQAIASIPGDQSVPVSIVALEPLIAEKLACVGRTQPSELQSADCPRTAAKHGQLGRRLAARQQQAAVMLAACHDFEQGAVTGVALQVRSIAVARLEQHLEVVQHQEASMPLKKVQKSR